MRTEVEEYCRMMQNFNHKKAAADQHSQKLELIVLNLEVDRRPKGEESFPFDPLLWWATVGRRRFPILARCALAVHGVPATEIECERIFSIAGIIMSKLRSRMSPEMLGNLVYIYKNWPDDATFEMRIAPLCAM